MNKLAFIVLIFYSSLCLSQEIKGIQSTDIPSAYIDGYEALIEKLAKIQAEQIEKNNIKCLDGEHKLVYLGFDIDTFGIGSNYRVIRGLNPKLDSIALVSIKGLNLHWTPSYKDMKKVPVGYQLPFRFCPDNNSEVIKKKKKGKKKKMIR